MSKRGRAGASSRSEHQRQRAAGACQPCSAHGQCESDVCDLGAATSGGPGACIKQADVVYVAAAARPACAGRDGTRANPVCDISNAIPFVVANRYAIRVYPGHYFPFGATDRTFFVFGPGDGSAVVGEEDISAGVRVTRSRVVLDGLDIGVHVLTGVVSQDSDVQVRRATVSGDYQGITINNSTLLIDQVRATALVHYGLRVAGPGSYSITNSYFKGGDDPAVVFSGSSTGRFLFNSVLGGGALQPGGIDCGANARLIQDSIVVGNGPAAGGAQTVGACIHRRVVVGSGDTRASAGLIKTDPDLDAEGRLRYTAADAECCIDKGERYVSSLYRDFFGTPRTLGRSNDIGAHEISQATTSAPASADAHIRTDLDVRRNDNYGCQESMVIGSSRGGGGVPFGGPDAMRGLVQFDLSGLPAVLLPYVRGAVLEMTVDSFDTGTPTSVYRVDAHRVLPSGGLTPWSEGNGLEIGAFVPPGCTNVDDASGIAWAGVGDGGDDNNQTQPSFESPAAASATISQASNLRGDKILWDVTSLVRTWVGGRAPNHGIVLRDVTSDGSFRGVRFGARDGLLRGFPSAVAGPRLIVSLGPRP